MRTLLLIPAAVAVLFVTGFVSSAQAQNAAGAESPGANASRYGIAVVDIGFIFKNDTHFVNIMKSMKQEMEATEVELKASRDNITQLEQRRNTYNAGSTEHKDLDEQLAHQMAEFNLKMTRLRKSFLEREAKVYYQTYLDINDAVKYYAGQRKIGLVLRFNRDPVDPNRREAVLADINKPVVFHNQLDITNDVLGLLNRDKNRTAMPATAPGSSLPVNR